MSHIIDTLLLLALPASGKSEARKFMDSLDPAQSRDELHMGATVQLDDFPYVHMMHRIDDELKQAGGEYAFYKGPDRPAQDPIFCGILIELLNEDHEDLVHKRQIAPPHGAASWLFERIDGVTVEQANAVIKRHYRLDNLQFVVLGDAARIRETISNYAGEPEILSVTDAGFGPAE